MLDTFLQDCSSVTVREEHIRDRHFDDISPTNSYFMVEPALIFAAIYNVLDFCITPVAVRKEGPHKLMVWIDLGTPVGLYRKWNVTTSRLAIVITKWNGLATVRSCYPDGV